ncbi:MAG: hypothetical protein JST85_11370 [Acidobacteria bacterium]|nr:hypothetical protein [Acidobacteriota bacterium]
MPPVPSIFLINSDTFKKSFLSGDGQLELQSDQNIWAKLLANDGKFSPDVDRIADIGFSFNNSQDFKFGSKAGMKLSVGASVANQIHLIWPKQSDDDDDEKVLKAYGLADSLTDGNLYVRLLFSAQSDVKADGSAPVPFPAGALSATFGVAAGGNVAYEQLRLYKDEMSAAAILGDLFASMRLPQQIDSTDELPAPGEVIATRFGGYLNLKAGLTWGFEMAGSKQFDVNQLQVDLNYALQTMAAISLGYQIAGDFSIEARRGSQDGWVRFVVRKNRDSQFNLTADFNLIATGGLNGLPPSADEFLTRLLGSDAQTVLGYFKKAEEFDSLDKLQAKLTPMVNDFIHKWSQELIGKVLDTTTFKEFFTAAKKVADTYTNLDQYIVDLYHKYLDKIPKLTQALTVLASISNPAELANLINSDDTSDEESISTLELVQIIWGTNVFPLLMMNADFLEFTKRTQKAHDFITDGAIKPLRDFIAKLKEELGLDPLFDKLKQVNSPDDLKNLADTRLQDLAGKVIGQAFDELKKSDVNKAFQLLETNLQRIENFKKTWYAKITEAVHQKFTFDLHFAYTRATRNKELLDIEFDLSTAEGRDLARVAALGDFAKALDQFSAKFVRVNQGVFTHSFTQTGQLRINVLGWGSDSLSQLAVNADHTIEQTAGGLLHVFATEASINEKKNKGGRFKESIESNFLLRAVGESFQAEGSNVPRTETGDYLIQTLRSMAVQYDLLEADDKTTPDELTRYLDLAEFLGLLTKASRTSLVSDMVKQFPGGLGKVAVRYVVQYDEELLKTAFKTLGQNDLKKLAKLTTRQIISSYYTGLSATNVLVRVGFANLSPTLHDIYDKEGFTVFNSNDNLKEVMLPGWFTKGAAMRVRLTSDQVNHLDTVCSLENTYAKRLVELNKVLVQKPIPQKALTGAAANFLSIAKTLDEFTPNTFFAIFDSLVQQLLLNEPTGRAFRQSSMTLQITPPGAKKSVNKVLIQPR